ncbi:MAG: DUF3108 domain-containing protein, partial [bacterium]
MKRIFISILAIVFLGILSPGAHTEVFTDYNFPNGVLWQIGGFEKYDILQRGLVVGEATIKYRKLEMLDQPAYRLEWTEKWTDTNGIVYDISQDTKLASSDLRVLMATRIENVGGKEWRYEGNYTGGNLSIGFFVPDDAERHEFNVARSTSFSDADVLPFLFRNIPLTDGNFVTFTVLDLGTQTFFTPIGNVKGSEIVETAKTQYDCWVVSVSTQSGGFTAYYSKSDRHYLVKVK